MTDSNSLATEIQVVRGCLAGDGDAIQQFMDQFRQSVYSLCYRFLRNHQDCEDVVQEIFLRALKALHRWDQKRPLRPWLMTIATNRCKTALAQRSQSRTRLDRQAIEAAESAPIAANQLSVELAEEIDLCLARLRPDQRECFVLFYRDQKSTEEISHILNVPRATVKTWLRRTREKVACSLKQRGLP